jgi:hypothetical protein
VIDKAVHGQLGSFMMDLSDLASGTYICRLMVGDRPVDTQRLVLLGY